mmetsp:Transcript_127886/g.221029  ORF Transcript_127886/g.221029 Transcript_127886/m.221029 type:complete len:91 (-) Transcript_127886:41-313(-)
MASFQGRSWAAREFQLIVNGSGLNFVPLLVSNQDINHSFTLRQSNICLEPSACPTGFQYVSAWLSFSLSPPLPHDRWVHYCNTVSTGTPL